jgi:hypothetical protein
LQSFRSVSPDIISIDEGPGLIENKCIFSRNCFPDNLVGAAFQSVSDITICYVNEFLYAIPEIRHCNGIHAYMHYLFSAYFNKRFLLEVNTDYSVLGNLPYNFTNIEIPSNIANFIF